VDDDRVRRFDDMAANAQEYGGRLGFMKVRAPIEPTDDEELEVVMVRILDGDPPVIVVDGNSTGERLRLLISEADLVWLLEHRFDDDALDPE
jgi:hypothetical protein